ncbi:presenilin family intramembrane aspartyl protease PSH [uncultured Methanomethylovorans sp.]|uniref:presenilin family intramembrane aspartyl protease PSH n=1 Tax=uncultured Methanomethylovorans sp. TaxID=183759 RepID=UPI002AA5EB45|nr:presenilin family intramembrane aspartyl protease PSH [uncultured Methanomethylovorans sp.]
MSSEKSFLKNYAPIFAMAGIILAVQFLSLFLAQPMTAEGMQAFENPDSTANSLYYIVIILIFTFFLLVALKKNLQWVIQLVILLAVASTIYYVFIALLSSVTDSNSMINAVSLFLSIVLTVLLYKFPEWYVINTVGLIIGAGASAIFGISLSIIPVLVLLSLLAIYDAISVYKTKHMIDLAEGVMDLRLPILFVIPKKLSYSFIKDTFKKEEGEEREAFFMGLGDAVMPTILVVSANVFLAKYSPLQCFGISYPSIGAMIGTLVGYSALMVFVMKGKPQAGLPFLNTGVILGYAVGVIISGIPFY